VTAPPAPLARLSTSPEATERLGRLLGALLRDGDCVRLSGELGAGKTRFVKGVAVGLGVARADEVVSPTFLRLEHYGPPGRRLRHIDAYRMAGPAELEGLDAAEALGPGGVTVVEWPERIEAALPAEGLEVHFEHAGPRSRRLLFRARGQRGAALLAALAEAAGGDPAVPGRRRRPTVRRPAARRRRP
jgi:tRNA threonylcarbamoyladenosine biosynthesis protein TsaE